MENNINTYPVQFYKTLFTRQWRWKIKASNGKIVAASTESFKNRLDCINNAQITFRSLEAYFYPAKND